MSLPHCEKEFNIMQEQEENINNLIQRVSYLEKTISTTNIITAELKEDMLVNVSTEKSHVLALEQATKIGDKLSITDGGIKIGQGVNHILVSANARLSSNTANKRASIQPSRNLENVSSRFKHISANGFVCAAANKNYGNSISSTLIDVQENDVIYLQIYTEAGANYVFGKLFCNLTVQVVN